MLDCWQAAEAEFSKGICLFPKIHVGLFKIN